MEIWRVSPPPPPRCSLPLFRAPRCFSFAGHVQLVEGAWGPKCSVGRVHNLLRHTGTHLFDFCIFSYDAPLLGGFISSRVEGGSAISFRVCVCVLCVLLGGWIPNIRSVDWLSRHTAGTLVATRLPIDTRVLYTPHYTCERLRLPRRNLGRELRAEKYAI